nr:alkaline phosphatase [Tunicatimonas sp. TK19036]
MHIQRSIILLIPFLIVACQQVAENTVSREKSSTFITSKVILVVIDGPRLVDTWVNHQRSHIPFQNRLSSEGTFFSNFYNDGHTRTLSGHTALLTGTYEEVKNDGSENPSNPTIFQHFLAESQTDSTHAFIITSKKKLSALGNCNEKRWHDANLPSVNAVDREDSITLQVALETLQSHHPALSMIHFRGPDRKGHANDWEGYLNSIEETDRYVKELWDFIQNNKFYKGRTALLITNDHGRHLDGVGEGFVGHGDHCEGCKHISLLALGPDFVPGKIVVSHYGQIDVAPTIAKLLNFSWQGEGHPIEEMIPK